MNDFIEEDFLEEPEYEDIEQMFAEMRDHMTASHIVSVAEDGELEALLASSFSFDRDTAELLRRLALVLRRIPESREHIADHLDEIATMIESLIPKEAEEEE
jgi:hypothetical protein